MPVCNGPAGERHVIAEGDRMVIVKPFTVNWGANDIRDNWTGAYTVCSFKCLKDLAAKWEEEHDGHVLREGTA